MSIYKATFAVIDALEKAKVPYLLSGSLASMFYSFPRATVDADFVIELGERHLAELAVLLGKDFRVDTQLSFETVTGTLRNEIDVVGTPFKVELFRLSADPFDQSRFARRRQITLLEKRVWLPTVEDVVIQKLIWNRPKDVEDLKGVVAANRKAIDQSYINQWCDQLKLTEAFDQLWQQTQ